MKKKIAIISIVFALACSLLSIGASALDIPDDYDYVQYYSLYLKDGSKIPILSMKKSDGKFPSSIVSLYSLKNTLLSDVDFENNGFYSYELYDGSILHFDVYDYVHNNQTYKNYKFRVDCCTEGGLTFPLHSETWFFTDDEIMFCFIGNKLYLLTLYYEGYSYFVNSMVEINTAMLSGCLYADFLYDDIYIKGYFEGKDVALKDHECESGGPSGEYKYTEEDLQNKYNEGYLVGQDSKNIVSIAINGFFDGLTSFFSPFMSIGIGSLTVYSMVGLALITAIIFVIIKVVRG